VDKTDKMKNKEVPIIPFKSFHVHSEPYTHTSTGDSEEVKELLADMDAQNGDVYTLLHKARRWGNNISFIPTYKNSLLC
jgi:hypothetical protein